MPTKTLLDYVKVVTYDLKKNLYKTFKNMEDAQRAIDASGTKYVNVYRLDKVNGTWRTDWKLVV